MSCRQVGTLSCTGANSQPCMCVWVCVCECVSQPADSKSCASVGTTQRSLSHGSHMCVVCSRMRQLNIRRQTRVAVSVSAHFIFTNGQRQSESRSYILNNYRLCRNFARRLYIAVKKTNEQTKLAADTQIVDKIRHSNVTVARLLRTLADTYLATASVFSTEHIQKKHRNAFRVADGEIRTLLLRVFGYVGDCQMKFPVLFLCFFRGRINTILRCCVWAAKQVHASRSELCTIFFSHSQF